MPVCSDCGGTVIEYDVAAGNGFCVQCGTVIEENTIVSEVTFGESSSGAAIVQGSYVGLGSTRARMGGPLGNRGSSESREQTIANASRKIQSIANVLHLSEVVCLAATRLYTLAVEHKFTKGRKSMNVVAVCIYVACRQKETRNYMLIDFSDLLQVNVFELGHTYLQLVQTLNLRLPLVDPSHYIARFAALLEFGEETHRVATDAIRLVQRFDRDWMARGRRPAGICGASLILAARMNNFRRSVEEVVQVVKIGDMTLRKRLDEFKRTSSASLSVSDFRKVWLEDEADPPAFTKGKEKEEKGRAEAEGRGEKKKDKKKGGKRKRKRRGEEEEIEEDVEGQGTSEVEPALDGPLRPPVDPAVLNQGILSGTMDPSDPSLAQYSQTDSQRPDLLFLPDEDVDMDRGDVDPDPATANIDPALLPDPQPQSHAQSPTRQPESSPSRSVAVPPPPDAVDEVLAEEVTEFLSSGKGSELAGALEEAEQRRLARLAQEEDEALLGLDEAELDQFILTEEEVKIKERVWVEMNRDYLEAIAARGEPQETASNKTKSRKKRKTDNKPRDSSTPHGSTVAESVRNLIKKSSKYSKRINYDALKDIFDQGANPMEDKEMYTFDDNDKSDGEGMVIVEEEGGGVGMNKASPVAQARKAGSESQPENEDYEEHDEDAEGESEKGEDYAWDEGWEQEV